MISLRDLCRASAVDGAFIETMVDYNVRRHWWVHRKLEEHVFPTTPSPTIAVWGLAYKKNTRSTKNSMSLRVIGELTGRADVPAWGPLVGASDRSGPAKTLGPRAERVPAADSLL